MESEKFYNEATSIIQGCVTELLESLTASAEWDDLGENDGVFGSQIVRPSGHQLIKATGVIKRSLEEVYDFLCDLSKKKIWDEMLLENREVLSFNSTLKVFYELFHAPWPISNRDFVYVADAIKRDDGMLLIGKSIEGIVPTVRKVVRGEVYASGFYLKRLQENITELTYLVSVDPKGMLPKFIKNELGRRQCSNVNKIRNAVENR